MNILRETNLYEKNFIAVGLNLVFGYETSISPEEVFKIVKFWNSLTSHNPDHLISIENS
jgi:hypothetical protein